MIHDVTVEDKLWGVTRCLHADATHEVWHASPKKGGYSSVHYHRKTPNKFYLVSGRMSVDEFRTNLQDGRPGDQPIKCHVLNPGQEIVIEEGTWHRFVALEDCELIELYWATLRAGGDIVRSDFGGIKPAVSDH